jgi:uncharacterized membrane protein YgdD (TMEM256/DUF423 family)
MTRMFIISAALLGLSGVGLGAFGAHGLAAVLAANERAATFDTAVQYHLIHALALLITALLDEQRPGPWTRRAGWLFILGAILFSGSLYLLAIFNLRFMGAVAPFGGAALMAGWACLGWSARR